MLVTYRFSGFQVVREAGPALLLEHPLDRVPAAPDYVTVDSR
jgi:hypothetical protein